MNFAINILFLVITFLGAGIFVYNLVLNLVRAIKINKQIKKNAVSVDGKVVDIKESKSRVIVIVEFTSPTNRNKFQETFELTSKEFGNKYYKDQDVKLYYASLDGINKVECFPVYLEGQKMKVEAGPIFTDSALLAGGLYVFIMLLVSMLRFKEASDGNMYRGLQVNGLPLIASLSGLNKGGALTDKDGYTLAVTSGIYLILIGLFYVMLIPYVIERIKGMSAEHKNNYLKLYGVKAIAEVKTFKFRGRGQGNSRESVLQIEYKTNKGEEVKCSLTSYLYSETQEQYIDILYDELNPKNVVYMRK